MKILVTGGAGFIGTHLCLSLASSESNQVIALDALLEPSSKYRERILAESGVRNINFQLGVDAGFEELSAGFDLVYHLAAESHNDSSIASPGLSAINNISATIDVLEAARRQNYRLHIVSTDEVFGDHPPGSEEYFMLDSNYRPSSPYSASKASGDLLAMAWLRTFETRVSWSYCGNNYGRFQSPTKLIPRTVALLEAEKKPVVYGDGVNERDWVHVSDHVKALELIGMEGRAGEGYMISAEDVVQNKAIFSQLLDVFERPADFLEHGIERPGHDFRYAMKVSANLSSLGWTPQRKGIIGQLKKVADQMISDHSSGVFPLVNVRDKGVSS